MSCGKNPLARRQMYASKVSEIIISTKDNVNLQTENEIALKRLMNLVEGVTKLKFESFL